MTAPTPEELVSQMASRGMTITTTDASGILCLVASISECLELNYPNDECRQNAIMLWASILISANTAGRYVTSQSAPSGASIIRVWQQAVGGTVQSDEATGYSRMHWRFGGRP